MKKGLMLTLMLTSIFSVYAMRGEIPKIPELFVGQVKIVVPNDDGFRGYVEVRDRISNQLLWEKTIYNISKKSGWELDIQWVFIKSVSEQNGNIIITDELERKYSLDLQTQEVWNLKSEKQANQHKDTALVTSDTNKIDSATQEYEVKGTEFDVKFDDYYDVYRIRVTVPNQIGEYSFAGYTVTLAEGDQKVLFLPVSFVNPHGGAIASPLDNKFYFAVSKNKLKDTSLSVDYSKGLFEGTTYPVDLMSYYEKQNETPNQGIDPTSANAQSVVPED